MSHEFPELPAAMVTGTPPRGVVFMAVQTSLSTSSLAEVLDRVLDKGIVIDVFAKVSLVGIEILGV